MIKQRIDVIPIRIGRRITEGVNLGPMIFKNIEKEGINLHNHDIISVTHKIVSKAEGRLVWKEDITVSARAKSIAEREGFDEYQVELALRESKEIIRERRALITLTRTGLICNFAGVDHSNAPGDSYVLLPENPDESAARIRREIAKLSGKSVAVIITDTEGRPWRKGAVNMAIGCAGINALKYNKGREDLYGSRLQRSTICHVDEVAAAAELVMGQADEAIPVVIVRGYTYKEGEEKVSDIFRSADEDLFR